MNVFLKIMIVIFVAMQFNMIEALAYEKVDRLEDMEYSIYNHLENRDNKFGVLYTGIKKEFQENEISCIKNAYSKDDYLERSWSKITYTNNINNDGIEATFDVTYLTTKEQENYIDSELKKITESLISANMSELEKVKVINEYIINRYEYDFTQKSISVYSALTTSLAACQGYSMTAYKMFKYAGIENRIIVGKINKDILHSWNLVRIDGNWYQLDITNNDSIEKDKYFLLGDNDLISKGYIWDISKYPKANSAYNK